MLSSIQQAQLNVVNRRVTSSSATERLATALASALELSLGSKIKVVAPQTVHTKGDFQLQGRISKVCGPRVLTR